MFGRVQRTSQIQARRFQCPVILDGYPFNEKFIVYIPTGAHGVVHALLIPPMILNVLFIKPSNITGFLMVCHNRKYYIVVLCVYNKCIVFLIVDILAKYHYTLHQ